MKVEIGQVVSQIICFLLMFWILKRYGWKPILNVIEERKIRIKAEFAEVQTQKNSLNNLIAEYKQKLDHLDELANIKMQEVIKKGKETALRIQEDAHHQAKIIILKTQADMQNEIAKAKLQLKDEIVKITLNAAEKVLQKNVDPEKNKELVSDYIDRIG